MTLRIGIDTSALLPGFKEHALRGIGRYVFELNRYFESFNSSSINVATFNHNDLLRDSGIVKVVNRLPLGRMTVRQQLIYPLRLNCSAMQRFDFLHFPAHMDAPAWSPRRFIVTVLDLIPLVLSDMYRSTQPGWRFTFARWLENRAITHASIIIAISENTARDVHRILGVPEDRIFVTPLGVDNRFFGASVIDEEATAIRASFGMPARAPVILYVGGIDQRKNVPMLLRALEGVRRQAAERGGALPVLVMAGRIEQDREYPKLIALTRQLGLEGAVFMPGYVQDSDLLKLYAMSSVFFFPSLYEGFGLPVLEAMAAGTPVVSSGSSSMPEVTGDAAVLIDPNDLNGAVRELCAVIEDSDHAAHLSAAGKKQAALFPWARTGELTLKAYESMAGIGQSGVFNG